MIQIGENDDEEKPKFTALQKNQSIEDITLEQALKLFQFPKTIGVYLNKEVVIGRGRFGPTSSMIMLLSLKIDPSSVTLNQSIELRGKSLTNKKI